VTWDDAQNACKRLGGALAIMETKAKYEVMKQFRTNSGKPITMQQQSGEPIAIQQYSGKPVTMQQQFFPPTA